jgi:hypothetical protein
MTPRIDKRSALERGALTSVLLYRGLQVLTSNPGGRDGQLKNTDCRAGVSVFAFGRLWNKEFDAQFVADVSKFNCNHARD